MFSVRTYGRGSLFEWLGGRVGRRCLALPVRHAALRRRPGLVVVASSRCSRCMSVGRPQILGLRLAAIARRYSRSVRHHRILVCVAPNSVSRARPLPSVNAHL